MAPPPPFTITRTIEGSPAHVFEAWIDPALMTQWFAPPPCSVTAVTVDPRPGGHYSIAVIDPDGNVHTTTGEEITVTHSQLQDQDAREGVGAGWALCLEQLQHLMNREP